MSRRKKAGRGGPRGSNSGEVVPDWKAEMPPASPPQPRKALLIVTAALLGVWMVFLAVMASMQ